MHLMQTSFPPLGLSRVAVTEFPWVILVLVISVTSSIHRILWPVVVSGRPREN